MTGDQRQTTAARLDPITGFGDIGALETAAPVAIASAQRAGHPLSVVLLTLADADDADARDRSLSLALRASVRATDQLFRIDASRIVLLLPMTTRRGVTTVMTRVGRLCDRPFTWGVATSPKDGTEIYALLVLARSRERADTFFA